MSGYVVDSAWNNLGKNTASISFTPAGTDEEAVTALIEFDGQQYKFTGTAKLSNMWKKPLYTGSAPIVINGQKEQIGFSYAPSHQYFDASNPTIQFVDGVNSPSYTEGYNGYKNFISALDQSQKSSTSSSTQSTVYGNAPMATSDSYIRGTSFGGSSSTGEVWADIVGAPSLTKGSTGNLYTERVWVDGTIPQAAYGTNVTGAWFTGDDGTDPDAYASNVYPNDSGSSPSLSVGLSIAYSAFSVSVGYNLGSQVQIENDATNWNEYQWGSWGDCQMDYSGNNDGNGLAMRFTLEASSGSQYSGTQQGDFAGDLQFTSYGGLGSSESYWVYSSNKWNFDVT